jgi:hypothetical protein
VDLVARPRVMPPTEPELEPNLELSPEPIDNDEDDWGRVEPKPWLIPMPNPRPTLENAFPAGAKLDEGRLVPYATEGAVMEEGRLEAERDWTFCLCAGENDAALARVIERTTTTLLWALLAPPPPLEEPLPGIALKLAEGLYPGELAAAEACGL